MKKIKKTKPKFTNRTTCVFIACFFLFIFLFMALYIWFIVRCRSPTKPNDSISKDRILNFEELNTAPIELRERPSISGVLNKIQTRLPDYHTEIEKDIDVQCYAEVSKMARIPAVFPIEGEFPNKPIAVDILMFTISSTHYVEVLSECLTDTTDQISTTRSYNRKHIHTILNSILNKDILGLYIRNVLHLFETIVCNLNTSFFTAYKTKVETWKTITNELVYVFYNRLNTLLDIYRDIEDHNVDIDIDELMSSMISFKNSATTLPSLVIIKVVEYFYRIEYSGEKIRLVTRGYLNGTELDRPLGIYNIYYAKVLEWLLTVVDVYDEQRKEINQMDTEELFKLIARINQWLDSTLKNIKDMYRSGIITPG